MIKNTNPTVAIPQKQVEPPHEDQTPAKEASIHEPENSAVKNTELDQQPPQILAQI